jgi:hypothetical protein
VSESDPEGTPLETEFELICTVSPTPENDAVTVMLSTSFATVVVYECIPEEKEGERASEPLEIVKLLSVDVVARAVTETTIL